MRRLAWAILLLTLSSCQLDRPWHPTTVEQPASESACAFAPFVPQPDLPQPEVFSDPAFKELRAFNRVTATPVKDNRWQIEVHSLSESRCWQLLRCITEFHGIASLEVRRSGRYSPASWDLSAITDPTGNALSLMEHVLGLFAESPADRKVWLDALQTDGQSVTLKLRAEGVLGGEALIRAAFSAATARVGDEAINLTVMRFPRDRRTPDIVGTFNIKPRAWGPPPENKLHWVPAGGPTSDPLPRDNDGTLREHRRE